MMTEGKSGINRHIDFFCKFFEYSIDIIQLVICPCDMTEHNGRNSFKKSCCQQFIQVGADFFCILFHALYYHDSAGGLQTVICTHYPGITLDQPRYDFAGTITAAERFQFHGAAGLGIVQPRTEAFGELLKTAILFGSDNLSTENYMKVYDKALRIRRVVCEAFEALFRQYDAVLLPACSKLAYTEDDIKSDKYIAFEATSKSSLGSVR